VGVAQPVGFFAGLLADVTNGVAALPAGWMLALSILYAGALLYFAMRLLWSLGRVAMLLRGAESFSFDAASEAVWRRCREMLGVGSVRTLRSSDLLGPVTVGLGAAVLVVPEEFVARCSAEDLLATLGHECAHIARRDFEKNLIYECASLLIAFHPVTWMLKRRIAETREMICDGAATEKLIDVPHYVQALLRLATRISMPATTSPAIGIFDANILEKRIMTMKTKRQRVGVARRVGLIAAGVVVLAGVVGAGSLRAMAVEAKEVAAGNGDAQDKQLYSKAVADINVGHYATARLALQTLLNTYHGSAYEMQAKFDIARSWDREGGRAERSQALNEYQEFIALYPNAPQADEARRRVVALSADPLKQPVTHSAVTNRFEVQPKGAQPAVASKLDFAESQGVMGGLPTATPSAQEQAARPNGPVRISGGVVAGNCVSCPNAVYPPIALAAHVQGAVVLHAVISKTGTVKNLAVISGPNMLRAAAMEAVRGWQYKPYVLGGEPTEVDTTVTVNFAMNATQVSIQPEAAESQAAAGTPSLPFEVKHVGGDVLAPQLIYSVQPEYTEEARVAKLAGNVVVGLIVDPNGRPINVHVVRGVGTGLDEKAVEAVKQYKFKPAMENGVPVAVNLNVEVNFKMF